MGMIWVGYRRDEATARALLADEDGVEELLESDGDDRSVDLDKAWHGIHWLLSEGSEPAASVLSLAIFGGEELGEDLGYGPPRLLSPADVKAVSAELLRLDATTLLGRLDPVAMESAEVYPDGIWADDDIAGYVASNYESLRAFYAAAAGSGEGVIQTLC